MIDLKQLEYDDLELFIQVIKVYLKHFKGVDKSSVNEVYKSVLELLLKEFKQGAKRDDCSDYVLHKHTSIVFVNAMIYYLGYPYRERHLDKALRKTSIAIMEQLKKLQ